jgi:hypothetical protein
MTMIVDGGWPDTEVPWWDPARSIWDEVDWWRWLARCTVPSSGWAPQAVSLLSTHRSLGVQILAEDALKRARRRGLVAAQDGLALEAAASRSSSGTGSQRVRFSS